METRVNKTPYLIATALLAITTGTALAQAVSSTAPAAPVAERKPLDANQDGVIDRSEAAAHPRLAARFDELDKNGDGKLDASEQPRAPMDRKGHRGPGGHGQPMAALDTDKDGRVSKAEADAEPKFAQRFAQMDANKDGYIDQADREAMARQQRDQWFDAADSNKDGSLSRAEFDAAQTRRMAGEHGRGPGRMPAPAPAPTK